MKFIKLTQHNHRSNVFLNVDHIVAVMTVYKSENLGWTRIWTTATEEGTEHYATATFTIDTDESVETVMEKILATKQGAK